MPPPPPTPQITSLGPPPPTNPPGAPPPPPPPPPPRGLRPTISWRGSWRPEPRGRPPRASHNANMILMHAENAINWDAGLPKHTKLCHYVENVLGLCPKHNVLATVQRVKWLLTEIYRVPLTVEQLGTSCNTLQLQISCVGPQIHWGIENKVILSCLTPRIPVSRYPDVHSLHAARIVHGMAVNLVHLAFNLHTHPLLFVSNCAHIVWEFLHKTYPLSWWMHVVPRAYCSYSDLPLTCHQFLDELPWVVTLSAKILFIAICKFADNSLP